MLFSRIFRDFAKLRVPGASFGVPGRPWGGLGGSLGDPWGPFGRQEGDRQTHYKKELPNPNIPHPTLTRKGCPWDAQGAETAPQSDYLSTKNGCRNSNTKKKRCELAGKCRSFVIFSIDKLTNKVAEFSANCLLTKMGDIEFIV